MTKDEFINWVEEYSNHNRKLKQELIEEYWESLQCFNKSQLDKFTKMRWQKYPCGLPNLQNMIVLLENYSGIF